MNRRTKSGYLALAALIVVGSCLGTGTYSSQAAPMGCSTPDAPPACSGPRPKPPVTPPTSLSSPAIIPLAESWNNFTVTIPNVTAAQLSGYQDLDSTRFRVTLSCTNGYFDVRQFTARIFPTDNDASGRYSLFADFYNVEPDAAAGACFVSTWDQVDLHLSRAELQDPGSVTNSFWIRFS